MKKPILTSLLLLLNIAIIIVALIAFFEFKKYDSTIDFLCNVHVEYSFDEETYELIENPKVRNYNSFLGAGYQSLLRPAVRALNKLRVLNLAVLVLASLCLLVQILLLIRNKTSIE
jgi:hypothetical protein